MHERRKAVNGRTFPVGGIEGRPGKILEPVQGEKRWAEAEEMAPGFTQALKDMEEMKGCRSWKTFVEEAGFDYATFRKFKERRTVAYEGWFAELLMTLGLRITWKYHMSLAEAFKWEAYERSRQQKTSQH